MHKDALWSISPDVRSTYSEDGAVLLDIQRGVCYSLNPTAAQIWVTIESSQSGIDFKGLVDGLEMHCKASREQLESDTAEYLSKLEHAGLVQRNGLFHGSRAASARG